MSECEYCSGSGCVYCRNEPEKVEAPEIVKERLNFTEEETGEFFFKDKGEAEIMARYLNTRCSYERTCPLLRSRCVTDCPCFKKAEVSRIVPSCDDDREGYLISGFRCSNLMLSLG